MVTCASFMQVWLIDFFCSGEFMWFSEVCWAFADVLKYRAVCSNERDMATAEVAFRDMASSELAFKMSQM